MTQQFGPETLAIDLEAETERIGACIRSATLATIAGYGVPSGKRSIWRTS